MMGYCDKFHDSASRYTSLEAYLAIFVSLYPIRVFSQLDEIGNNANIGIRDFTTWKQKNQ